MKKKKKYISSGRAYINSSYNNTIICITDLSGEVLSWRSSGTEGFKGSKKSTPYAAQIASKAVAKNVKEKFGLNSIEIFLKGPGPGRESAIRGISNYLKITYISDITGIPHNGCRPPKERRI